MCCSETALVRALSVAKMRKVLGEELAVADHLVHAAKETQHGE